MVKKVWVVRGFVKEKGKQKHLDGPCFFATRSEAEKERGFFRPETLDRIAYQFVTVNTAKRRNITYGAGRYRGMRLKDL